MVNKTEYIDLTYYRGGYSYVRFLVVNKDRFYECNLDLDSKTLEEARWVGRQQKFDQIFKLSSKDMQKELLYFMYYDYDMLKDYIEANQSGKNC